MSPHNISPYALIARIDAIADFFGVLRESHRTPTASSSAGSGSGEKIGKKTEKKQRKQKGWETEMCEKPSYSRAASMESFGSGITLKRGF